MKKYSNGKYVYYDKRRNSYLVQVRMGRKRVYFGNYDEKEAAQKVADDIQEVRKYHEKKYFNDLYAAMIKLRG